MQIAMDVDSALSGVPVNLMPLLDDTDFKTRETAVAYNAAGMDLVWNFVTTAGVFTQTAVTPTTSGDYDWTHKGDGMYSLEIPASGGASINNTEEGFGWFTGVATGVLPWRGPVICFRASGLNDVLVDSAYSATRGLAGTALPNAAAEASGGLPTLSAAQASNGTIQANVHRWLTGTPSALQSGRVDSYLGAVATGVLAAASFAAGAFDAVWTVTARILTAATNITSTGGTTVPQTGDTYARLGAPAGVSVSADVAAVKSQTAAIETDTAEIGTAGAGLTALASAANLATVAGYLDTEIQAILDDTNELQTDWTNGGRLDLLIDAIKTITDALPDAGALTSLATAASIAALNNLSSGDVDTALATYDAPTRAELTSDINSVLAKLLAYVQLLARKDAAIATDNATEVTAINADGGSGAGTFANTTDSQEAIRDRGDAAWTTGAGGSAPTVEEIRAEMDANSTQLAAIVADTNELQGEWADGGRLDLILDARASQTSVDDLPTNAELSTALAAADDAVLAAIAALNDLSQADIRTAVGLGSANLDTQIGDLPTNAELATALAAADDAVLAAVAALNDLSAADIRTAVGLATANLDTQLGDLPTNAELSTALAAADDAVLAAIAALNNLSAAQVDTAISDAALATAASLSTAQTAISAIKVITDALTAAAAAKLEQSAKGIVPGTVDTGSFAPTVTEFEADDITEATADHYIGRIVTFTSGALDGQSTDITDYALSGANGHFTVTALTEAPSNDMTFVIT